ncbi:iron-regulated aconitate hydratase [Mycobacterium tuberculosis variant microti]|nr:iron-regulated aconitate hydratase [Mycobacterium tuberculosis variant microti]
MRVKSDELGEFVLDHGAVVIAAITSCTNTSNPEVMLARRCWPATPSKRD